jgi:hypothetical protein
LNWKPKKKSLEGRIIKLEDRLGGDREDLERVRAEINEAVATKKRIKNLGLTRLAAFTKFIADCEILGFRAKKVQKLAALRKSLLRLNIDPEKLEEYLEEKGRLDAQISELKRKAGDLTVGNVRLETDRTLLLSKSASLSTLDKILSARRIYVPCKICGIPLPLPVENREEYEDLIEKGLALPVFCPRCGWQLFTPMEIIAQIGWALLPEGDDSILALESDQ